MSQIVQTPVRQITLEKFLALPDTKPASEYIDGEIIQKPMPQKQHSIIQKKLLVTIDPILGDAGIAQAFLELQCIFGDWAIIPDVAVFKDERIPHDENWKIENIFSSYPDWIIEILSPDESTIKLLKNISYCLAHGTQMGWLIDPNDRSIFVCMPVGEPTEGNRTFKIIDEPTTVLPVPAFAAAIELTVGQTFSWIRKKNENQANFG